MRKSCLTAMALLVLVGCAALREQPGRIPAWIEPPAAVKTAFKSVVAVRVVIHDPARPAPEGQSRVRKQAATGFAVAGAIVTAAHVVGDHAPNDPDCQVKPCLTGEIWTAGYPPLPELIWNRDADVAVYRHTAFRDRGPLRPLVLATRGPSPGDLVWWVCRGGMLADEWSVGRYLDTVESVPGAATRPTLFVNPWLGGIHAGCSGAPVLNAAGHVVGMIVFHNDAGSVLNAFAVRVEELREALNAATMKMRTAAR